MHHLIIYAPLTHSDLVREALARAGAGKIGHYDSCSFSVKGIGRFRPLSGAHPAIGTEGQLEMVEEERIEAVIPPGLDIREVVRQVKTVHPYEEPAIHVLPMVDYRS